jgi:hypothetical protein
VKISYHFDDTVDLYYVPSQIIESNLKYLCPVVTFPPFATASPATIDPRVGFCVPAYNAG